MKFLFVYSRDTSCRPRIVVYKAQSGTLIASGPFLGALTGRVGDTWTELRAEVIARLKMDAPPQNEVLEIEIPDRT